MDDLILRRLLSKHRKSNGYEAPASLFEAKNGEKIYLEKMVGICNCGAKRDDWCEPGTCPSDNDAFLV